MANKDFKGAPAENQNALKRTRIVSDTLRRVAVQNPDKLRAACESLLEKAASGDVMAYKEIRDTLDGKPMQSVEMNVTRTQSDMDDAELARIISEDSSRRTTSQKDGKKEPRPVH